jgi:hypothetical protein
MRKVYYGQDLDSRSLNHYATERKDHKYIDRIPIVGGGFRYIYNTVTNPIGTATNVATNGVKTARKAVDAARDTVNKLDKAKRAISSAIAEEFGTTRGKNEHMHSMNQHMHSMNQGVVNGKSYKQVQAEEEAAYQKRLEENRKKLNQFKNIMGTAIGNIGTNVENAFKPTTTKPKSNSSHTSVRGVVTGKKTSSGAVTGKKKKKKSIKGTVTGKK